jgi:hypothetical protein
LNLQSRARWTISLELPWNPARLEQRAGRVDRIGQQRPVHVTLLVARHSAETGVLARLARRALVAQRDFGRETLRSVAPDESTLRRHLLGGDPLVDSPEPRHSMTVCRSWSRAGRIAARQLEQQRQLARHWQASAATGRPGWTSLNRFVHLAKLIGPSDLLLFSVPIVDRSGAILEHHVVAIRVPSQLGGPGDRDLIAGARAAAARRIAPRLRRLVTLRRRQLLRSADRDRAIGDGLASAQGPGQVQPGLFESRAMRAAEATNRAWMDARRDLDSHVRATNDALLLEIGTPRLELFFKAQP